MSGQLTHSPADVLRYLLVSLSGGTLPSDGSTWPIYVDSEPDSPDNCITIYNTAGRLQGRTQIDGIQQEFFGIQLRIRATDSPTAWTRASLLTSKLDSSINNNFVSISGTGYVVDSFSRTSEPVSLGRDESTTERELYVINGTVSLEQQ